MSLRPAYAFEWIDFSPMGGPAAGAPSVATSNGPPSRRATRGMNVVQVHAILGAPGQRHEGKQGDLPTLTETCESTDDRMGVPHVGGVIVKYSTTSK